MYPPGREGVITAATASEYRKGNMIMKTAYRVVAYLLALSVAVQASLIAFGAFALENALHGLNALAIFAVALLAGRRVPKAAPAAEPSAAEEAPV